MAFCRSQKTWPPSANVGLKNEPAATGPRTQQSTIKLKSMMHGGSQDKPCFRRSCFKAPLSNVGFDTNDVILQSHLQSMVDPKARGSVCSGQSSEAADRFLQETAVQAPETIQQE